MVRSTRLALLSGLPILFLASATEVSAQCEALLFDGADDVAMVMDSNNDFDMASAMTLEAWVRVDVIQTGGAFVGARIAGGAGAWVMGAGISTPADGVLSVSTPNTDAVFAPNAIVPGTWTHFAGTWDGTDMTIYVDGAFVAMKTHPVPGDTTDAESLVLGMFPNLGSGLFLNGAMDELRVWNVVRTAAEIGANYMQPLDGDEPGLVGYYKFDEGGGDVLVDSSLFGNDGFLGATAGPGPDDPLRIPGLQFTCSTAGTPFCFGDGSGTGCPCGNTGGSGEGCANSSGAGGVLDSSGTDSAGADDLEFSASNLLPFQPALLFVGENAIMGGNGIPFGDGLRCAGLNVVRLGVMVPDANGAAAWGPGLGATGGWSMGDTRYFQGWYRDPVNGPCGTTFNLTNAIELTFTP